LCSEADKTLNTNEKCNEWRSGCVTTGKGCTDILQNCDQIDGDDVFCNGVTGLDGKCEGKP
jgi:hypothetical protein